MDYFFAHYEYVSLAEISRRIHQAGFGRMEELKARGMDYDRGWAERMKDPFRRKKYGDGQLRAIISNS